MFVQEAAFNVSFPLLDSPSVLYHQKVDNSNGTDFLVCKKCFLNFQLFFQFFHPRKEYIFPLPRNTFPREGTGVKTNFIFCEKVSLSTVVGKRDGCLTRRSSCTPKRRRVDSAGKLDSPSDQRPRKGKLSHGKENSQNSKRFKYFQISFSIRL